MQSRGELTAMLITSSDSASMLMHYRKRAQSKVSAFQERMQRQPKLQQQQQQYSSSS
jgi:hypothetical protein